MKKKKKKKKKTKTSSVPPSPLRSVASSLIRRASVDGLRARKKTRGGGCVGGIVSQTGTPHRTTQHSTAPRHAHPSRHSENSLDRPPRLFLRYLFSPQPPTTAPKSQIFASFRKGRIYIYIYILKAPKGSENKNQKSKIKNTNSPSRELVRAGEEHPPSRIELIDQLLYPRRRRIVLAPGDAVAAVLDAVVIDAVAAAPASDPPPRRYRTERDRRWR